MSERATLAPIGGSPSTAQRDVTEKQATYHQAGVQHYWLLDPTARTLTALG